jgi:hypothetical protein
MEQYLTNCFCFNSTLKPTKKTTIMATNEAIFSFVTLGRKTTIAMVKLIRNRNKHRTAG